MHMGHWIFLIIVFLLGVMLANKVRGVLTFLPSF